MNKQAGNVVQWIILGIVVIGVAVAVIWRYTEAEKAQNEADQAANQSNITPQPKDVVKLPGWNVEIKDSQEKYGTVTAAKDDDSDAYVLTSSELKEGTYTCEGDNKGELGTLTRGETEDPMAPSVKVGDKYYSFVSALQNECYEEAELNTLGKDFGNQLSVLLVESK